MRPQAGPMHPADCYPHTRARPTCGLANPWTWRRSCLSFLCVNTPGKLSEAVAPKLAALPLREVPQQGKLAAAAAAMAMVLEVASLLLDDPLRDLATAALPPLPLQASVAAAVAASLLYEDPLRDPATSALLPPQEPAVVALAAAPLLLHGPLHDLATAALLPLPLQAPMVALGVVQQACPCGVQH